LPPERSVTFEALFPDGVAVFRLGDDAVPPDPMPGETRTLTRAVPRRRAEFARGRACARAALGALGHGSKPIPVGPDRAPVWPEGVVGSITHCRGLVAAAVGPTAALRGLGLDAEPRAPIGAELARRIATDEERSTAGLSEADASLLPRLLFSAKEVVHKCIYPLVGVTLDFLDVAVTFDHARRRFSVSARSDRARAVSEIATIDGRYHIAAQHIVTGGAIIRVD
jgi:4'-phosphopantetheinyl transferase EntD